MTTFAKAGFLAADYAAFRPSYPAKIFTTILTYHQGPKNNLLDLGCGHGLISRELSSSFRTVVGTDPSSSMISQAQSMSQRFENVNFFVGTSEDLNKFADGSLDMVVAGQAAHWFDHSRTWLELKKKVRAGGTLSYWGYKDNIFVDYPKASKIFDEFCYGPQTMGPFWEQPGRNIVRNKLRDVVLPADVWEDVQRIEYEPGLKGKSSGDGEVLMAKKLKLGEMESYARTFSSYHNWMEAHKGVKSRRTGGEGDIVDEMFDKMLEAEPDWRSLGEAWRDFEVEVEWGSYILMARRK